VTPGTSAWTCWLLWSCCRSLWCRPVSWGQCCGVSCYRYLSFAMVAGRPLAFLLPAVVVLINVREMQKHVIRSIKRYGAPFIEYASRTSAIVPGLWPAMSCAKADGEEEKAK